MSKNGSNANSPKLHPQQAPTLHPPNGEAVTGSGIFKSVDGREVEIRDVWASNLEEEMEKIREVIEKFPYVAMVSCTGLRGLVPFPVASSSAQVAAAEWPLTACVSPFPPEHNRTQNFPAWSRGPWVTLARRTSSTRYVCGGGAAVPHPVRPSTLSPRSYE